MTLRKSSAKQGKNQISGRLIGWRLGSALLCLLLVGCPRGADNGADLPAEPPRPVRLLVIDDAGMAEAIEREWRASGQGDLKVSQARSEDLSPQERLAADCVIYPAAMLGQLVESRKIVALPDYATAGEAMDWDDIFPLVRLREANWSTRAYGIPYGSPVLVLVYRRDVLEKLGKQPPQTWEEYQELADLLDDRAAVSAKLGDIPLTDAWRAAAEPLAAGWAGQTLLARAASAAHHEAHFSTLFDFETMEPLIDGPPLVRALEQLVAASKRMPADALDASPDDVRNLMAAGKCGLALTWLSPHEVPGAVAPESPVACGVQQLPGVREVYNFKQQRWERQSDTVRVPLLSISGRFGSVTTSARHTRSATEALAWLASPAVTRRLATGTSAITLCRRSQVSQPEGWAGKQFDRQAAGEYAQAVSQSLSGAAWLSTPRIPGRERYLAALDEAVRKAVRGEELPADALRTAADRWREITKELGLDAQRSAYQRSLGLEP